MRVRAKVPIFVNASLYQEGAVLDVKDHDFSETTMELLEEGDELDDETAELPDPIDGTETAEAGGPKPKNNRKRGKGGKAGKPPKSDKNDPADSTSETKKNDEEVI